MTDTPHPAEAPAPTPRPIGVALTRGEFLSYNWALALERPVLPFLAYTFVLFALAGLLGVLPAGRVLAAAALAPALVYAVWVWGSASALWARHPELAAERRLHFKERSYLVAEGGTSHRVPYDRVARVLETRSALYLARTDGGADIVPKRVLEEPEAFAAFLRERVGGRWKGSSFLG